MKELDEVLPGQHYGDAQDALPLTAADPVALGDLDFAGLADEFWWEEALSVGEFSATIRLQPDRWARETIVASILHRSGFTALRDAARALIECDEARGDVQPLFERATALARAALAQAEGRS